MELYPYNPFEEIVAKTASDVSRSYNGSNGFWWGMLTATVVYGVIVWIVWPREVKDKNERALI